MNLEAWANKHNIPAVALYDLMVQMGLTNTEPTLRDGMALSEAAVQNDIRLEASKKGMRLWRNNVGVAITEDGRHIRYGLCNDSKRMNDMIKSSDLVGIKKVMITRDMVGTHIGQFVAREVKAGDWTFSGTQREEAQRNFLNLILSYGGDAAFAKSEGTL